MNLNLSSLNQKQFCTLKIMNASLFMVLYPGCFCLTAWYSAAMPSQQSHFPRLCVCAAPCTGCSRLPVFLNRASCQGRCSSEYVQHVLQAQQQLPENWKGQSSALTAASELRHRQPHWNLQGMGSYPQFWDPRALPPIKHLICRNKLRTCLLH